MWTQGVGRKVQPTTAPGAEKAIAVETMRVASAAYQLVVHGEGGRLEGVKVVLPSDLTDESGDILSKDAVTFFRPAFIDFSSVDAITGSLTVPSQSQTKDGQIPDPLIPLVDPYTSKNAGQPFSVDGDRNMPVFVEIVVPQGTPPGTYTGTIQVSAKGSADISVPLSVTVWDLDLPDMRTVTTHFKMTVDTLMNYHEGTSACSGSSCYLDWNDRSRTVVKRYSELAHAHRIDTGQEFVVVPSDGCTIPSADAWQSYDDAMAPFMDGSYFSDGVPSGFIDVPFEPGQNFGPEQACNEAGYVALAKAWSAHLKQKGWFERALVYAYDEPPQEAYPNIALNSKWLAEADPDFTAHVLDTVAPTQSNIGTLGSGLGIFVVVPWEYDNWENRDTYFGRTNWPTLFAQGKQLWFYEGNSVAPPYPTFATNTLDGLEPVMYMWGSWFEHATGFLYWDIAAWKADDPWGPEITWGKTGDGVLIYPGNHNGLLAPKGSPNDVAIDGPIPSYRLKMLRKGLEDWALFRYAESKGLGDMVRTEVAKVYGQFGACNYSGCPAPSAGFFWKTDEAIMGEIRKAVAMAIIAAK